MEEVGRLTAAEQARLMQPGVPWDDLDPGIAVVVEGLALEGFETIASCQGHGEGDAWVAILPDPEMLLSGEIDRLCEVLRSEGWEKNCLVSVEQLVEDQGADAWIKVRWWGQVPFR